MRWGITLLILVFGFQSRAAIYGSDQRKDISLLDAKWQQAAQAVAVALPTFYLLQLDGDHYYHDEHDQRNYAEQTNLCKDERFANQKSFGHCSAFLIHPKLLVTAGHCLLPAGQLEDEEHSYCENFSFWLGYNDLKNPIDVLGSIIPKKDVVHCKKVVYATNNGTSDPEDNPIDFAIFELEEEVTHIEPLKLSKKEVRVGEAVATIGHPHGLPAKFSGLSLLAGNYKTTLSAYLDTLGGNSGGPAFNQQAELVGVLISGHQTDTYKDNKAGCERINKCSNNGKKCKVSTKLENSNLLMKRQIWQPYVKKYLIKNLDQQESTIL